MTQGNLLNILSLTSSEFSLLCFEQLKRGKDHALNFYKHFFQSGQGLNAFNPKEPQSKILIEEIQSLIELPKFEIQNQLLSEFTEKYVLRFQDGLIAELVVIPMKTGLTLCISSQVGCKMACRFCETGKMGKLRDLKTEEIVCQLYFAKIHLKKDIKNIVFMGMGEPFDNYHNVTKAINVMTDIYGLKMPYSSITVSTSGIVPKIYEFIEYGKKGVKLAVSINGSNPENRQAVMPITRKYSMDVLKEALKEFTKQTESQILAEYVMILGINDQLQHARELSSYLETLPSIINLIPYNPQSIDQYQPPDDLTIKAFQKVLLELGHKVFIRQKKGIKSWQLVVN